MSIERGRPICTLCWSDIQPGARVKKAHHEVAAQVDHLFHEKCLNNWLEKHNTCPTCLGKLARENPVQRIEPAAAHPVAAAAAPHQHDRPPLPVLKDTKIFTTAIREHNLNALTAVLDEWSISDLVRSWAVRNAAKMDHPEIVDLLIKNGFVSQNDLHRAFLNAASANCPRTVDLFLQKRMANEESCSQGLWYAAHNGHLNVILVFEHHRVIRPNFRDDAVYAAVENNHYEIVELLLHNHEISQKCLGSVVISATLNGNLKILALLLQKAIDQKMAILKKDLGIAVRWVSEKGYEEAAKLLLKQGTIEDEARDLALQLAKQNNHLNIAALLEHHEQDILES